MRKIILIAIFLLSFAPAKAADDAFGITMWREGSLIDIGDTANLVWTFDPKEDADDDLLYLIVSAYPDLRIDKVKATGGAVCTSVHGGFDCRSIGIAEVITVTATVTVIGPGVRFGANGEIAYAHAVVGAFAGGRFGHTILQDTVPTALDEEDEPLHKTYFPEVNNG